MTPDTQPIEEAVCFDCDGDQLVGVLSRPSAPIEVGIVIVVGGPQYRAGSHRQFVSLARRLTSAGHPVLRFDYRGMGDSDGAPRGFEQIDADLRAAIDALIRLAPSVRSVALWGLCDGASAALMYAHHDPRVRFLILANPWARGEETLARTRLRHYYVRRLLSPDFWRKLLLGTFRPARAAAEFGNALVHASRKQRAADYRSRLIEGWERFAGKTLLLIATADLTAQEFLLFMGAEDRRRHLLQRVGVSRVDVTDADHTFSRHLWQSAMEAATVDWLPKTTDSGRTS